MKEEIRGREGGEGKGQGGVPVTGTSFSTSSLGHSDNSFVGYPYYTTLPVKGRVTYIVHSVRLSCLNLGGNRKFKFGRLVLKAAGTHSYYSTRKT